MQKSGLGFSLVVGGVVMLLAACGGAVEPAPGTSSTSNAPETTGSTSTSGGNTPSNNPSASSSGDTAVSGSAACGLVEASALDTSCTTDADCVIVPEGGNTCTPCDPGDGVWGCPLVPINVKNLASYQAALSAGLAPYANDPVAQRCIVTACPIVPPAVCSPANVCTVGKLP